MQILGSFHPPLYETPHGEAVVGDSLRLLNLVPDNAVDMVLTSPPFALQRQKDYGNKSSEEYVAWLAEFGQQVYRVLKPTGSLVLDLGGAYEKGRPVRSLYNYRILIHFCDVLGFRLAEEFFWFNPSKLPSPIEWVNKRKIRVKDAVNTIWWLSKMDNPKADSRRVLVPYSRRMKQLLDNPEVYYSPNKRPSGHDIGSAFERNNGGAIPPNLLKIPNTDNKSQYHRYCGLVGVKTHPARFPEELPSFFIKFLTEPGDLVMDIFAGSNTTGHAAEVLGRQWIAFEEEHSFLAASAFRFAGELSEAEATALYQRLMERRDASVLLPEEGLHEASLSRPIKPREWSRSGERASA